MTLGEIHLSNRAPPRGAWASGQWSIGKDIAEFSRIYVTVAVTALRYHRRSLRYVSIAVDSLTTTMKAMSTMTEVDVLCPSA